MSADEPLDHCLEGATQNQDESLNSTVWNLCLKESFARLNSVETACAIAVARFNDGSHISKTVMRRCGLNPGRNVSEMAEKEDRNRVYHAKKRSKEGALVRL